MENFDNVLIPITLVILMVAVIMILYKMSNYKKDKHFDEMQLKIRGNGYKLGFFVSIVEIFFFAFLMESNQTFLNIISPSLCMYIVGFSAIVAFAVYCIIKDAFYSLGQSRKVYILLCVSLVVANGYRFFRRINSKLFFDAVKEDETIYLNLLCVVSFSLILIALIIRELLNRKEVEE